MGSSKESPDKICSWEGYNQEDPAAAGPVRVSPSTVDPAGGHTDHTQRTLNRVTGVNPLTTPPASSR